MTKLLPLFVYGTARVGQPLYRGIKDAVVSDCIARAPSMQLMVPRAGYASFPYMVRRPGSYESMVWGDLLLVERNHEIVRLCGIEAAAGYTLEGIRVKHNEPGLGDFALAFVWDRPTDLLVPWGTSSWLSRRPIPVH